MLNLVLTLIVLSVPVYFVLLVISQYMAAPGSTLDRIVAAFKNSASITWARLNALSVVAVGALSYLADLAGAPGVKDTIAPYLAPQYMTAYILFVLIGAEIARRRTLP